VTIGTKLVINSIEAQFKWNKKQNQVEIISSRAGYMYAFDTASSTRPGADPRRESTVGSAYNRPMILHFGAKTTPSFSLFIFVSFLSHSCVPCLIVYQGIYRHQNENKY
jgi:hypothetical protein